MVSRFFRRPSRSLKHHTVSLLPEVEAIIQTSVSQFVENITRRTGDDANFSVSLNLMILGRLAFVLTDQRKGRKSDPDAIELIMDLIDGNRRVNEQDLQDWSHFMTLMTEAYNKRHENRTSLTDDILRHEVHQNALTR